MSFLGRRECIVDQSLVGLDDVFLVIFYHESTHVVPSAKL